MTLHKMGTLFALLPFFGALKSDKGEKRGGQ